jgi:hypothetical protein
MLYLNGVSDATPVSKTGTITDGGESIVIGNSSLNDKSRFSEPIAKTLFARYGIN